MTLHSVKRWVWARVCPHLRRMPVKVGNAWTWGCESCGYVHL